VAAAEHVVDVMGTRAHVIVTADDLQRAEILSGAAVARLRALEAQWSRFRDDSEISALNAAGGAPVALASETLLLVERSIEAWHRTDGAFDPTVLPALLAAGYDRDFRSLDDGGARPLTPAAAPGCDGIVVDGARVTLPEGVQLDGGGIGKGLAADLVVDLVMSAGAAGACVNVGGDLRVAGHAPGLDPWSVTIEHPLGGRDLGTIRLRDEALVSSWRTRRTWGSADDRRHHLIDPTTGAPAWSGLAGVTVLAGEAWWAEALATALFLAGADDAAGLVDHHGISALLVRDDGAVRAFGRMCAPVTVGRGARAE
jgi:thiamine biosynthesis lipoprotein